MLVFIPSQFSPLFIFYVLTDTSLTEHLALLLRFSLNPSFFQLRLLLDLSALQATKDDHNFSPCCYRILFPFLIRRRTQHGEMKVKAAHYFFTSEQEQNQMFHICSCSLQHYHEKAKGVFQCSTAHCFRIEMETSVKTPTCLCQMSP